MAGEGTQKGGRLAGKYGRRGVAEKSCGREMARKSCKKYIENMYISEFKIESILQ